MTATFEAGPAFPDDRLLPWPKVRDLTGISRTTAWRLQKAGDFPLPVVISPGRVGWRESEVQAWKASRAPRAAAPPRQEKGFLPFAEREPRPEPATPSLPPKAPPPPPTPTRSITPRNGRKRPPSDSGQITFDFG